MAVVVRKVWQSNLESKFHLITRCMKNFRFASMDTEFPGNVFTFDIPKHGFSSLSAAQHYALMRENVNALNIIQLGLTLSNSAATSACVWEINFRDFDSDYDSYHPDSLALLHAQGLNLDHNSFHNEMDN